MNQGVGNKNVFLPEVKVRLHDKFVQNWNTRFNESSRAKFYSFFSELEHQPYLEVVKVKKYRIAMSKLRVSSHRLEIEVERR